MPEDYLQEYLDALDRVANSPLDIFMAELKEKNEPEISNSAD